MTAEKIVEDKASIHVRYTIEDFLGDYNQRPEGVEPIRRQEFEHNLLLNEGITALLEKLNALPEEYRQVILFAKVEGLSTQEMAERLGRSRESAALLLHRALKRLRSLSRQSAQS